MNITTCLVLVETAQASIWSLVLLEAVQAVGQLVALERVVTTAFGAGSGSRATCWLDCLNREGSRPPEPLE